MVDKKTGFQNNNMFGLVLFGVMMVGVGLFVVIMGVTMTGKSQPSGSIGSVTTTTVTTGNLPVEPKGVAKEVVVNLSGKWTANINGTDFNVDVTDTTITIKLAKGGNTMLYWYGTFSNTTSMGKTITSDKLDIDKAVLSGAASKNFVVGDNSLTFEVSAMGQTRDVEVRHVA